MQCLWVHTDRYAFISNRHINKKGFGMCSKTGVNTTQKHTACALMKRKGIERMVHGKQLCNCFWETALVGVCHRFGLYRGQLVCSVCGRRPGQQRSLSDCGITFINSIHFDVSLLWEGKLSYLAWVVLQTEHKQKLLWEWDHVLSESYW